MAVPREAVKIAFRNPRRPRVGILYFSRTVPSDLVKKWSSDFPLDVLTRERIKKREKSSSSKFEKCQEKVRELKKTSHVNIFFGIQDLPAGNQLFNSTCSISNQQMIVFNQTVSHTRHHTVQTGYTFLHLFFYFFFVGAGGLVGLVGESQMRL